MPLPGRIARAVAFCALALWSSAAPAAAFSAPGSLAVTGRASASAPQLRGALGMVAGAPSKPAAWLRKRSSAALVRCAQGSDAMRGGASEPNKVMRLIALLTNLFPFWVLAGAALGLFQPQMLKWLKGEYITAALASTMLFMGMTLEVLLALPSSDVTSLSPLRMSDVRMCLLRGVSGGRGTVWSSMVVYALSCHAVRTTLESS